jgi:hypothetical protein
MNRFGFGFWKGIAIGSAVALLVATAAAPT